MNTMKMLSIGVLWFTLALSFQEMSEAQSVGTNWIDSRNIWRTSQPGTPASSQSAGAVMATLSRYPNIILHPNTNVHQTGAVIPLPSAYLMSQNFPNPINPTNEISYALPEAGDVLLKFYNVLGQEMETLVDEVQDAGYKVMDLDASNLPTGGYFYQVQAGKFSDVKKMLLMK